MNGIERKQHLLKELEERGNIIITEQAERLGVSSMTIRRDLNALAANGLVTLEHGGAVLNNGSLIEYNMGMKRKIFPEEKRRIAVKCLEYINEGDSIYLDAGTTPNEVAMLLRKKKSINVLTHSLQVANTTMNMKNIKLIMCPGEFRERSMAFMGPLTDSFIQNFQIDTFFLSVEGIDLNGGVSVMDVLDGHTKKTLIQKAKRVVCISDSSKFGKSFFYKIAPLEAIDIFITDTGLDPAVYEELQKNNIAVELA